MKNGKTLNELAAEITRQQESKKDFVAPTTQLEFDAGESKSDGIILHLGDKEALGVNGLAHRQIGEHVGIPAKYYDRMRTDAPQLLARNVNHWFQRNPSKRMVRTLDGKARAFLSDRYRPLENADLAEAVLPVLLEARIQVLSCEITETRLYIKGVDERINLDVPTGKNRMGDGSHVIFDTCSPAIVISNSEVGMGALSIETAMWTKACTNLAIFGQKSLKKYHVGGRHELTEGVQELLSDRSKALSDASTWSQVKDVVKGAFDEARFAAILDDVKGMKDAKIEGDPIKAVDLTVRKLNMTEGEGKSILRHLIEGGDLSKYGLFNAITRTAEDLVDYDRATDFERFGGQIIELANDDWKRIAEAA